MTIELECCTRETHHGIETVEFTYLIDGGEARVLICYEKCYSIKDGYPADWKGINEWSMGIKAGADFNVAACGAARWAQLIGAVGFYHESEGHQDWVVSGRTA